MKEIIISTIIIFAIIIGNNITQKYTIEFGEEMSNILNELKNEINNDENEIEEKSVNEKLEKIDKCWNQKREKLAYFIEHNELEKVENNMTTMRSFVNTKEYTQSISEIEECIFILKHIEEKYAFNLENVF